MSTPAARTTLKASAVTSGPMPSPPMTAILWVTSAPTAFLLLLHEGSGTTKPPTEVDGRERTPKGWRVLRGYEVRGRETADHDGVQSRRRGSLVAMSETTETHLSPDAYERLRAELEDLTTRGRVEVAHRIEAARALGDLSENGDYHAAKDDQGKMEARIRKVEALLKNAKILQGHEGDVISPGAVVGLRYEGDDDVEKFLIGSIEEQVEGVT